VLSFLVNIRSDLIARVCIITAIFSIVSYAVVLRDKDLTIAVPALFVLFGVVVLISILYDLRRFHVITPKPRAQN
jgi:hypothetical protein